MKKAFNILVVCVSVWCAGIVLLPIIVTIQPIGVSIGYSLNKFYGVVCHQFDSRSFHINGHPFAVCIRCTAIYFGFLFGLLGVRFSSKLYNKKFNPTLLLVCSLVPMMLDIGLSVTPFYEITTPSRLLTGSIFGISLALLLHRSLTETIFSLKLLKYHDIETR